MLPQIVHRRFQIIRLDRPFVRLRAVVFPEIASLHVLRLLVLRRQAVAAASRPLGQVQIRARRVQGPSKLGPLAGALLQIPDLLVGGEEAAVGPSRVDASILGQIPAGCVHLHVAAARPLGGGRPLGLEGRRLDRVQVLDGEQDLLPPFLATGRTSAAGLPIVAARSVMMVVMVMMMWLSMQRRGRGRCGGVKLRGQLLVVATAVVRVS